MHKIKKKKKKVLIIFLLILIIGAIIYLFSLLPIKNINIYNNKIISDQEIIETSSIENYPSFLKTTMHSIKKKLKKHAYIKDVRVTKGFLSINIYVEEYMPLFIKETNNKVILENGTETDNFEYLTLPVLIGEIEEKEYNKLLKSYIKINDSVKEKISEIKYDPTEYDKDRFIFMMNDKNHVYITLTKIENINKYDEMVTKFEGKEGILYLDSGNYFEIKK